MALVMPTFNTEGIMGERNDNSNSKDYEQQSG